MAHAGLYRGRAQLCRAPLLAHPGLRACSSCCMPAQAAMCLLRLLCACSGCYMPAQAAMCHNTAKPTICLLSLLCATIQLSLLCACLAFYVPQYNRAYCVPTQPSMCHNTAEPTAPLSRYNQVHRDTPQPAKPAPSHDTILCIATQFPSQTSAHVTIHLVYCDTILPTTSPCSCHNTIVVL